MCKVCTFHGLFSVQSPSCFHQRMVERIRFALRHGLVKVHSARPGLPIQRELTHCNIRSTETVQRLQFSSLGIVEGLG